MPPEYLHAHWRMPYIKAPKKKEHGERENPFLSIPHSKDPKAALLLYKGSESYLVMNKFPYNAGHLLALPYREAGDIEDLSESEFDDLNQTVRKGKKLLRLALNPDGFNIGYNLGAAAGAGIPGHLHCHLVPRWSGDTNFMPVIGSTRVLPEAMEAMWERLHAFVPEIEA